MRINKRSDEFNNLTQIVIQRSILNEILPFFHKHCGHFGMAKTFDWVREQFYGPVMRKDVHEWISASEACCQKKSTHQKYMQSLTIWKPSHPFWQVALHFMGPLPESSGTKNILLIGDQFRKLYEAIPMSNQEASTATIAFVIVLVSRFGCPVIPRVTRAVTLYQIFSRKCAMSWELTGHQQQLIILKET